MSNKLIDELFPRIREIAALFLWDIGAIRVNLKEPFTLVSGDRSPIYINCRKAISDPAFMQFFAACAKIVFKQADASVDVIAGGETAGIPFAAFIAQSVSKPLVYIRKKVKSHGIASLVEGQISQGAHVLLVEDLVTDGGSKLHFIEAIRKEGGVVEDALVLFDRLQGGARTLKEIGVKLHAITDMDTALAMAEHIGLFSQEEILAVRDYLKDPGSWCP